MSSNNLGWNSTEMVQYRIEQWQDIKTNLSGTGVIGDTPGDHNMYICFGYTLGLIAQAQKKISILDWGGAFGHFILYAKRLFPDIQFDYVCKEVSALCEAGKKFNNQITFVDTDEKAFSRTYDLVFSNGSLQYSNSWIDTLGEMASAASQWVLISRMYLANQPPITGFEHEAYGHNVWVNLIDRSEFLGVSESSSLFKFHEMNMIDEPFETPVGTLNGKAFLFKKYGNM